MYPHGCLCNAAALYYEYNWKLWPGFVIMLRKGKHKKCQVSSFPKFVLYFVAKKYAHQQRIKEPWELHDNSG